MTVLRLQYCAERCVGTHEFSGKLVISSDSWVCIKKADFFFAGWFLFIVVVHGLVRSVSRARLPKLNCIILHHCLRKDKSVSSKDRTGAA